MDDRDYRLLGGHPLPLQKSFEARRMLAELPEGIDDARGPVDAGHQSMLGLDLRDLPERRLDHLRQVAGALQHFLYRKDSISQPRASKRARKCSRPMTPSLAGLTGREMACMADKRADQRHVDGAARVEAG